MYMNQLTIIGFTGQDADFHFTPNRTPVATISVATKESWKNEQGEWQSRTEYHRVVAFSKLGEYAKTLARVFEPFFSTKSGGSGLGLPTAHKIIETHGGRLAVQSEPGRGTQFTIELPVSGPWSVVRRPAEK